MIPETNYAQTVDGTNIAYQVVGGGPIDVLVATGNHFPIDMMWEEPHLVRFLDRLSTFCRHIWFDPRGTGASDRIASEEGRLSESMVDDMVAVLDAVGSEQAAVIGLQAPQPLLFAATHPARTTALVLVDVPVVLRQCDDNPSGLTNEEIEDRVAAGAMFPLEVMAPSLVNDQRFGTWFARASRLVMTPGDQSWRAAATMLVDLRPALPAIQAPTLVIASTRRRMFAAQRIVAERVAGARLNEIDTGDLLFFVGETGPWLDAIEEFLTGQLTTRDVDRVLATVLFTDVVGSTEHAVRLGDRRWTEMLATHDTIVRSELQRFRGREVKSTGDGVLATFDGPGRGFGARNLCKTRCDHWVSRSAEVCTAVRSNFAAATWGASPYISAPELLGLPTQARFSSPVLSLTWYRGLGSTSGTVGTTYSKVFLEPGSSSRSRADRPDSGRRCAHAPSEIWRSPLFGA